MKIVSSPADGVLGQPTVVSIGNFDGLHLGHRAILETVLKRASELGLQSAVMTFEPHPIQVLAPDKAPKRISTLMQKQELIRQAGVDLLFVATFDAAFAQLSPEAFVRTYLIGGLHARSICVGSNFNFGHKQAGTVATLTQWKNDFEVIEVPSVTVRGKLVSSTAIRQGVAAGAVSRACRLLGRWIEIEGPIVDGEGRGRKHVVPTFNLESANELVPARGVYISRIALDGGPFLESVTNIGIRPTFGFEPDRETIETFVLAGNVPQESHTARLQFLHRIRDERRFPSVDALRGQIAIDVEKARKYFRLMGTSGHVESRR
jgi:riboflavin kinase / FMN adenylyltransferase